MSNPGVRILVQKQLKGGKSFAVEDNIGEAIHIHYGNLRIDLTVCDFIELAADIRLSINDLMKETGFDVNDFDPLFLDMFSDKLIDLERVIYDKVSIDDLKICKKNILGVYRPLDLKYSEVIETLSGKSTKEDAFIQINYHGETNQERTYKVFDFVKRRKENVGYIVLFNDDNIIRDGRHRAASLLFLGMKSKVDIVRLYFKDMKYGYERHPYFRKYFWWTPKRVKNILRRLKRKFGDSI